MLPLVVAVMLRAAGEPPPKSGGRFVLAGERAAIANDGLFQTRRVDTLHRCDSKPLVRLQHELAFRKRRVRGRGRDPEADPLVARWRQEIRALRGRSEG